jgi:hypothetical protein
MKGRGAVLPAVFLLAAFVGGLRLPEARAATLLVYNNNDAGAGSLRQAVYNNNALGGANTIVFSNVVTGVISLTTGELLIAKDVTIAGPGASVLGLTGLSNSRVFNISNSASATINDITIEDCQEPNSGPYSAEDGAAMINYATLSLNRCIVAYNSAHPGTLGGASVTVHFRSTAAAIMEEPSTVVEP